MEGLLLDSKKVVAYSDMDYVTADEMKLMILLIQIMKFPLTNVLLKNLQR